MGLLASKLYDYVSSLFGDGPPARILMLGLDGAGKTTILYKVKLNENVVTIPTIGFNVEEVHLGKGCHFTVWDVGAQETIRRLWQHYFQNTQGLVYVVDSSDQERFVEARKELFGVIEDDRMAGVPVTVIANNEKGKKGIEDAASCGDVVEMLGLATLRNRKWHIQAACATTGEGIFEALFQTADMVKQFQKSN